MASMSGAGRGAGICRAAGDTAFGGVADRELALPLGLEDRDVLRTDQDASCLLTSRAISVGPLSGYLANACLIAGDFFTSGALLNGAVGFPKSEVWR